MKLDSLDAVDRTIEYGVADRGVSAHVAPTIDGELASEDGGPGAMPVLDDVHQIIVLLDGQFLDPSRKGSGARYVRVFASPAQDAPAVWLWRGSGRRPRSPV